MKDHGKGGISKTQYVFSGLGLVRDLIDFQFKQITQKIVQIMVMIESSIGPNCQYKKMETIK